MKVTISHYEFLQKFPNETAARTYLEDGNYILDSLAFLGVE
jgi:hypothetical protein